MNKTENPCKEAVFNIDGMVNEMEFALDNISVIQSSMVASGSEGLNYYGSAIYCTLNYLYDLQVKMRECLDAAFKGMRAANE